MARRVDLALAALVLAASGAVLGGVGEPDRVASVAPRVEKDGTYRPGTVGESDADSAIAFVADALPVALSYDHRALDKSLAAATERMTSAFARTYTATFDAARETATEKKATVTALVRSVGVVSASEGKATLLAFVDQVLVSGAGSSEAPPAPAVTSSRVLVRLVAKGEGWALDDVRPQ